MKYALTVVLVFAVFAAPAAFAQGGAGEFAPPKPEKEKEKKKKAETPLKKIIKELKSLVALQKAQPAYDKAVVKELERLIRTFEKMDKPVSLDDLSEADRKRLEEEVRRKIAEEQKEAAAGRGGGGGREDWAARAQERALEQALEGIELDEKRKKKVETILTDFTKDYFVAMQNRDYKLQSDLKKDCEKELTKVVGRKKAKDIMNNVNRNLGGRRGGWGR
jgi:hypothetical protein